VAVFFGSYVILIFLICLNVIIAIISEAAWWKGKGEGEGLRFPLRSWNHAHPPTHRHPLRRMQASIMTWCTTS